VTPQYRGVVLEEHGRRQNDVGVSRGVGHELLVHAHEQVFAAKPRRTFSWCGATASGLVFWMSIALTGGPFFNASASPVRMAPTRDWSRRRTRESRTSSPSIMVFFSLKTPLLLWNAPRPRTPRPRHAGIESAACRLTGRFAAARNHSRGGKKSAWSCRPAPQRLDLGDLQAGDRSRHAGLRVWRCASSSAGRRCSARDRRGRRGRRGTGRA